MTTIRFATVQDTGTILQFIRDLAEYEKMLHAVVTTEDQLKESLFGSRKVAEVLLAEQNGEPVGFAVFFHNFSTFTGKRGLFLEDLYVKPEARGAGAGLALLKKLAEIAEERGCPRIDWWVLDWNQKAIDFYVKLGAKPLSDWTVYRLQESELKKLAES